MTFAGIPLWIPGLAALAPAIVFVFVYPRVEASGFRAWLLRWGHPLAWVLLSLAAFVGYRFSLELAYYTALAGLTAFLGFFGAWSTATQVEG